ncbi:MAG: methionine biosynthesis protein MetW [Spirochaetales bacterium]|nr:methionine biosynthesis protein MetW [Spirochaetales bacterium]
MEIDKAFCQESKKYIEQILDKFCKNKTDQSVRTEDWQDKIILDLIQPGDSVLDLGCGDGNLLLNLKEKGADVQGVELDFSSVMNCVDKGVSVFHANLDEGLSFFHDNCFDYVVLEETAQTLRNPKKVFQEMLRLGKFGIITFPNFGYWKVRLGLLANGKMPVTDWLPYSWSDTPNIHLFTLLDFIEWTEQTNTQIVKGYTWKNGSICPLSDKDNLEAEEVLLILRKKS